MTSISSHSVGNSARKLYYFILTCSHLLFPLFHYSCHKILPDETQLRDPHKKKKKIAKQKIELLCAPLQALHLSVAILAFFLTKE